MSKEVVEGLLRLAGMHCIEGMHREIVGSSRLTNCKIPAD